MDYPFLSLFFRACRASGEEYLACERALRDGGPEAARILRAHAADGPDPTGSLLGEVVAGGIEGGGDDHEPALAYLDVSAQDVENTPEETPSPRTLAGDLTAIHADRAAGFLALRLVKQRDWPAWKRKTVLLYLRHHRVPATLPALIRVAVESEDTHLRALATEGAEAIGGPTLAAWLFDEARFWRFGWPEDPAT